MQCVPSDAPASKSPIPQDSPLEEDGFELAVPREGKAYAQPLQASIAVSDLNL
jgi:hypothetical protein